jgi:hypothetical protein
MEPVRNDLTRGRQTFCGRLEPGAHGGLHACIGPHPREHRVHDRQVGPVGSDDLLKRDSEPVPDKPRPWHALSFVLSLVC